MTQGKAQCDKPNGAPYAVSHCWYYCLLARTSEYIKTRERDLIGYDPISDGYVVAHYPMQFSLVCAKKRYARKILRY